MFSSSYFKFSSQKTTERQRLNNVQVPSYPYVIFGATINLQWSFNLNYYCFVCCKWRVSSVLNRTKNSKNKISVLTRESCMVCISWSTVLQASQQLFSIFVVFVRFAATAYEYILQGQYESYQRSNWHPFCPKTAYKASWKSLHAGLEIAALNFRTAWKTKQQHEKSQVSTEQFRCDCSRTLQTICLFNMSSFVSFTDACVHVIHFASVGERKKRGTVTWGSVNCVHKRLDDFLRYCLSLTRV